jgi:hypothetical protein
VGFEYGLGFAIGTLNLRRKTLQRAAFAEIADPFLPEIEINEDIDPVDTLLRPQGHNGGTQFVDAGYDSLLESIFLGTKVAIQGARRDISFLGQAVNADSLIAALAKAAADRRENSCFGFLFMTRSVSRHANSFYIALAI